MTTSKVSRRGFLAASGMAATAVAVPGLEGRSPLALAADGQTNLSNLVNLRLSMFNHFNLGTFTNEEWAAGGQSPSKFAPSSVDCGQWAAAAAAAKMSYGVLTTKHHDGFSLWPTAFGTQNVAYSGYRQDVVRQYVDAFRARGLRVGLYYSIWDRGQQGLPPDTSQAPRQSACASWLTRTASSPQSPSVSKRLDDALREWCRRIWLGRFRPVRIGCNWTVEGHSVTERVAGLCRWPSAWPSRWDRRQRHPIRDQARGRGCAAVRVRRST